MISNGEQGTILSTTLDLSTLEAHLWEAANILRGPVDEADFKTYIQQTIAGDREVRQALRKTLFKYKLHQEQDLFDRAYEYIKQYY